MDLGRKKKEPKILKARRTRITPSTLARPGPPGIPANYSHGMVWRDLLFLSGQVAYGPDGEVVQGGIAEQTRQALDNMQKICEEAGTSIKNMLKVTVYMTNIEDFAEMDRVYKKYFDVPPTRTTVEVSSLVKTGGAKRLVVEIEGIAAIPSLNRRNITSQ
jgi:2-iminobutanoate/2-iminopropanoate deaminase